MDKNRGDATGPAAYDWDELRERLQGIDDWAATLQMTQTATGEAPFLDEAEIFYRIIGQQAVLAVALLRIADRLALN